MRRKKSIEHEHARHIMKLAGCTNRSLAQHLGVAEHTVSHVVRGLAKGCAGDSNKVFRWLAERSWLGAEMPPAVEK